jgi:hypothetical protein
LQTPLLIHSTTNDEDVNVLEVENLIKALKAAGRKFEHKIYKDAPGGHEFNRIDTKLARDSRMEVYQFLAKYLNPPSPTTERRPSRPSPTRNATDLVTPADDPTLFDRSNLVAWCIVPFDGKNRGPAERAAMVKRLGFTKVAYDWRDHHVGSFEDEILQYKKHGIEYFAFWGTHDKAFDLFAKYDLHPQIWQTLASPNTATQQERVAAAARQILPLVERTAKMKCKLGLYNHGGWGGEPESLVAVCKLLREEHKADHVGIVYNMHHGHDYIQGFAQALARMKPYLLCLNLNGMSTSGPKILQLGAGEHDVKLLNAIRASGYRGPIGIIGHTGDDVEARLQDNLDGLDWILPQLDGKAAGPRPKYRTR